MASKNVKVEVRGFDELAAGTKTLARHIAEAAPDAFRGVAADVAGVVSSSVPRRTGLLGGSVFSDVRGEAAVVGYGEVPYARFVEFGGRGHPATPEGNYLYPSARDAIPLLVEAGTKAARDEIASMNWPSPR